MRNTKDEFKSVFKGRILRNEQIAACVYSMEVEYPGEELDMAGPGRFVNLYINREDLLLPRPISICRIGEDRITLVYRVLGEGTKELSKYAPGTAVRISSPLGTGFDLTGVKDKETLIVGGGIGIPPLLELAHSLKSLGASVTCVLGFKDEPFLVEEFKNTCSDIHIATDSGSYGFKGTVLELIKSESFTGGQKNCFACGPLPMLKALSKHVADEGGDIQISLEERMGCGFGACVGCVFKIRSGHKIELKKVCKDGPVFDGKKVMFDA